MANAECAHCGVLYIDIGDEDIDGPGPDYCPMSGNGEHEYRRCEIPSSTHSREHENDDDSAGDGARLTAPQDSQADATQQETLGTYTS